MTRAEGDRPEGLYPYSNTGSSLCKTCLCFDVPSPNSQGVAGNVNNKLSGERARRRVQHADWIWRGAFGFGFAFNDTIRFGLVLKSAASPKAVFTGSYWGKKPIRHKRIFKSKKNHFPWIRGEGSLEKTKHMPDHLSRILPSGSKV